jgi:hypothetical protein
VEPQYDIQYAVGCCTKLVVRRSTCLGDEKWTRPLDCTVRRYHLVVACAASSSPPSNIGHGWQANQKTCIFLALLFSIQPWHLRRRTA